MLHPREWRQSVEAREALCSTALSGGLAFLHARYHTDCSFQGSWVGLGRTLQTVPFAARDRGSTRLFFLVCCDDHRIHLHPFAHLRPLSMRTDIVAPLLGAPDAATAYDALVKAEHALLPPPAQEKPSRSKRRRASADEAPSPHT